MKGEHDNRRPLYAAHAAMGLIALAACVFLYVLSYGPYCYMERTDWFDPDTNRAIYRCYWPLTEVMWHWRWFGHLMSWYLSFWVEVP
jgi:hypothetical protein